MTKKEVEKVWDEARKHVMDKLTEFVFQSKDGIKLRKGCSVVNTNDDGSQTTIEFWSLKRKLDPETGKYYVEVRGRSSDGYHDLNAQRTRLELELWELTMDEMYEIIKSLPMTLKVSAQGECKEEK